MRLCTCRLKRALSGSTAPTAQQQYFLIHLFWDSECISGHQQLSEQDRAQSVIVSHCHFLRALHGTTACSFQEVDKAVTVEFLLTPGLLLTPVSLESPSSSVCPVRCFKGSSSSILLFCRYDLYFTFNSANTTSLCLLVILL